MREEDLDEAGLGIVVELRFFYPNIVGGQRRLFDGFPQVEVGIEDAMG